MKANVNDSATCVCWNIRQIDNTTETSWHSGGGHWQLFTCLKKKLLMKQLFPTDVLTQLNKAETEKTWSNLWLNFWVCNQRVDEREITDCLPVDAASIVESQHSPSHFIKYLTRQECNSNRDIDNNNSDIWQFDTVWHWTCHQGHIITNIMQVAQLISYDLCKIKATFSFCVTLSITRRAFSKARILPTPTLTFQNLITSSSVAKSMTDEVWWQSDLNWHQEVVNLHTNAGENNLPSPSVGRQPKHLAGFKCLPTETPADCSTENKNFYKLGATHVIQC